VCHRRSHIAVFLFTKKPTFLASSALDKVSVMSTSALYEHDFYAWANEQAALLRAGKLAQADIEHIAEEIESMGKSEKRELVNRLSILLMHLLKWQFQPTSRSTGWRLTIEEQRDRLADHLADNPSLKATIETSIITAHRFAILGAARETGLDIGVFPTLCPWTFEQIIAPDFWPT
jgi:hypothetical protein